MDEVQFNAAADATLARIEQALDQCDAGFDYEIAPGGVIEIEFQDGGKIVINRHTAAREIWVAARSGGFHFKLAGEQWIGTRDGVDLFQALSALISKQSGASVQLG